MAQILKTPFFPHPSKLTDHLPPYIARSYGKKHYIPENYVFVLTEMKSVLLFFSYVVQDNFLSDAFQ